MKRSRFLGLAVLWTLVPLGASAHLGGQLYERPVGEYLMEISTDALEIWPHVPTALSFALIEHPNTPEWDYVPGSVDIDIRQGETTLLTQHLERDHGGLAYVSFTFPTNNVYDLTAVFRDADGKTLGSTTVPLIASRSLMIEWLDWIIILFLLLGIYVGALMAWRTSSSRA